MDVVYKQIINYKIKEKMTKTNWKKMINPDYLGSYSLDNGKGGFNELAVTIKAVSKKIVKGPEGREEECVVAELEGQKPVILNNTNLKAISKSLDSSYIEDWVGKRITLFVKKIKAFGDWHDAIRVKESKTQQLPELKPGHEKWDSAKTSIKNKAATIEAVAKHFYISPENRIELCK